MKVTVNFGVVRVIVPCGSGDLVVRRLMELAITRYKKATGKDVDVIIHNLKILSDGGILDPDDKLNDVADDREQIIATFEETSLPFISHNKGDGTSASSVGTESPDFFQNQDFDLHPDKPYCNGSDVEIAPGNLTGLLPLHVRRGSEPALNRLSPNCINSDTSKRWSAAIMVDGERLKNFHHDGDHSEQSENDFPPGEREDGSGEEKSSPTYDKRREPLGGPPTSPLLQNGDIIEHHQVVQMKNEDGPLGIHVVPSYNSHGKEIGLLIQSIEPGSRIDRDGRFSVGDKITKVNGLSLDDISFQNAQNIFKDALRASEISLACTRSVTPVIPKHPLKTDMPPPPPPPPPVFPKPFLKSDVDSSDGLTEDEKVVSALSKSKMLTPTKIVLGYTKNPSSAHSSLRKVGRRILIHLTKGSVGLGFSVSSKESGAPLLIKNILPTGAAVEDGRLKVGDRILEVNRVDVTSKTQAEVVELLRQTAFGDSVELVVSRAEADNSPSPHLPRQLPPEQAGDEVGIFPWKKREVYTLDIPLNDTGSAGLGVSVKGKTSTTPKGAVDMGIFVKSVIHGGAASKDGRLRPNDQLLNINGISLLAGTNSQAMETLRRAVLQGEGPNAITLIVARRLPSPLSDDTCDNTDSSCHEKSDSMLSESGESFYVSNENLLVSPNTKTKGLTPDTSTSDHSGRTVIHNMTMDTSNFVEEPNVGSKHGEDSHSENQSILDQLTSFVWQGPNLSNSQSYQNGLSNGQHKLTLIDVHPNEHYTFSKPGLKARNAIPMHMRDDEVFHQKSSSCSSEISPRVPLPPKKNKGYSRRHKSEPDDGFYRNGFGRQSMPEKELCQLASPNPIDYVAKSRNGMRNPRIIKNSVGSSSEHIPREMAVDVQPPDTYSKVLPKKRKAPRANLHQNENMHHQVIHSSADSIVSLRRQCAHPGSCHSPGCPYHAVPINGSDSTSNHMNSACVGPTLGMCKSSSLESLQTMVHQIQKMDTRGCNESFRAAVDRSYEAPNETVLEIGESSSGLLCRPFMSRSHLRSTTVGPVGESKKDAKPTKKKGLLKGLGSVFRFGKSHKKTESDSSAKKTEKLREQERLEARKAAEEERERIQQHYLKLVQQQKLDHIDSAQTQPSHGTNPKLPNGHISKPIIPPPPSAHVPHSSNPLPPHLHSRQAKMHHLRAEHQRRHMQRQGYYPREEQEELYEQQIKKIVDKKDMWRRPLPPLPHHAPSSSESQGTDNLSSSTRSKSYEIYKEMSKPGSRKGFVDPDRYSHYMNFQEIQHQLQQYQGGPGSTYSGDSSFSNAFTRSQHESSTRPQVKSSRQHRHTLNAARSRPVSDFLDYESMCSIQSKLHNGAKSLPRQSFTSSRQRLPIPEYMMNGNGMLPRDNQYSVPMKRNIGNGRNEESSKV